MELSVKFSGLLQAGNSLSEARQQLEQYRTSVDGIKKHCPFSGSSRTSIVKALNYILGEMEQEKDFIRSMEDVLEWSLNSYNSCENKLLTVNAGESSGGAESGGAGDIHTEGNTPFEWKWSNTWNLVSKAGIIGSTTSVVGNVVTGSGNLKTGIDSAKYVNSIIGSAASAIKDGGTSVSWAKYLTGTNNALKDLDLDSFGNTFKSSWEQQVSGLSLTGAETTAAKVKVASKWAGNLLTVAGNAYENYNEMQEDGISAGRAVAETVVESAVDIGVGMAATAVSSAAVGAVAAAIGVTAAPALAVGAVAVGVTWAANGVCKWVTGGKDLGEVAADFVCDVGEGAVQWAKDIGSSVESGLSAAWNGLCVAFG